MLIFTF